MHPDDRPRAHAAWSHSLGTGELREDPRTAKALLVAVSGYGQPQDREGAMAAGFDDHLVKPVPTPQLLALLDAAAERGPRGAVIGSTPECSLN